MPRLIRAFKGTDSEGGEIKFWLTFEKNRFRKFELTYSRQIHLEDDSFTFHTDDRKVTK